MQNFPKFDSDSSLRPQSSILTKKLELLSVVVSESECDVLRVAFVVNQCGAPVVGVQFLETINRGRILIWNR